MRVAFLFPGQGTDLALVGEELTRSVPEVRAGVELAARAARRSPSDLWVRGGRLLERTEIFQPVLTGLSLGVHAALAAGGVRPAVVAGHSLGEIAAWAAAGGIAPEEAVWVAAERGRLMAERAAACPGGLLALLDTHAAAVEEALALGGAHGAVHLAATNAPGEWVVGGEEPALRAIAGAVPSARLPVAGPWHGPAMAPAVPAFREVLRVLRSRSLSVPFVSNLTGNVVEEAAQIPELLIQQLVRPVRWAETMCTLLRLGVTDLVTLGPGKTLRGLVRKNRLAGVQLHSTERPDHLARTLERLRP